MAVSKLAVGFAWTAVILWMVACTSTDTDPPSQSIHPSSTLQVPKRMNCLLQKGILVPDSVLLYAATIANNNHQLFDHAGNARQFITRSGDWYYSYNDGPIEDTTNYFNTPLKFYRTLSPDSLGLLMDSLRYFQMAVLPQDKNRERLQSVGETTDYFWYTHLPDQSPSCHILEDNYAVRRYVVRFIREFAR